MNDDSYVGRCTMSAHKISVPTTPYAPTAFSRRLEPAALLLVEPRKRDARGVLRFLHECGRRMGLMKLSFDHAELGDGAGSRERATIAAGTKRLGRAWMTISTQVRSLWRARQNRQERSRLLTSSSRTAMEHPLRTLFYEVFVEPILRFLHWPMTQHVEVPPIKTEV